MLTEHQQTYFETFGFLPLRGLFSPREVETFKEEFKLKMETTRRFTGPQDAPPEIVSWTNLGAETPLLASLIEDSRIVSIAEQLLGEDCVGLSCNSISYVNDTAWHGDNYNFAMHSIKFLFYMQPVSADSGALRVITGSHKKLFHDEVTGYGLAGYDDAKNRLGTERIQEGPAFICDVEPGEPVVFDSHIWHASCGGSTDRRTFSITYSANPKTTEEEEALLEYLHITNEIRTSLAKTTFESPSPEYPLEWLENPENDPRRQRWIDWLHKWQFTEIAKGTLTPDEKTLQTVQDFADPFLDASADQ